MFLSTLFLVAFKSHWFVEQVRNQCTDTRPHATHAVSQIQTNKDCCADNKTVRFYLT